LKKLGWLAALVAGICLLAILFAPRSGSAGPSSLSASKSGWAAARRYLELEACRSSSNGRPLSSAHLEGTLVIALPEDGLRETEDLAAMVRHVRAGGDILLAFSGERPRPGERSLFDSLGLKLQQVRGDPPLSPARWYRYVTAVWDLQAEEEPETVRPVRVHAPRWIPSARGSAQVLYRGPEKEPMVFLFRFGRGRVVVVPADALSNSRLSNPGNADLLESLRASLGPQLVFDEYTHGYSTPGVERGISPFPFDLLVAQLGLLYLLAVLALSWGFGATWKQTAPRTGSTASFLTGLASRHRQLKHFRRAAELLLSRVRQLDPSIPDPGDVHLERISDEKTFLEFARRVSSLKGAAR